MSLDEGKLTASLFCRAKPKDHLTAAVTSSVELGWVGLSLFAAFRN